MASPPGSDSVPRLRIAIDASSVGSEPSGARTRLVHLLSAYASLARRHEIVLLCTERSGLRDRLDGVVEPIAVPPSRGPLGRWLGSTRFLRRIVVDHRIDLLSVETLPVPRPVGAMMMLTLHDLRDLDRRMTPVWSPRALYARWFLPRASSRVAMVVVVSRDTASRVIDLGLHEARVAVVPNAPDPTLTRVDEDAVERFRARHRVEATRYLLALGHLEPRKNLALLVDVAARLRAEPSFADVGLVLAGRDLVGEGARLARRARRLLVPLSVTGSLDDADRAAALSGAACVAVPSRVEGFGIVPLEAMALRVPVVTSDATALPEIVGDAALRCDPDDVDAWVDALRRLLADEALRADLVAAGTRRAAEWTWDDAARELREVHDRLALRSLDGRP